jgi:VanZ family protein
MTDPPTSARIEPSAPSWSVRIIILALAGILFLTLYPFQFDFARRLPGKVTPFLLGGWGKTTSLLDVFLNVLLFVPYGFGIAHRLRQWGRSKAATFILALAAGAALSYLVEVLQFYIPQRDSGWGDVITNSTGSVVGFLFFEMLGPAALRFFAFCERSLVSFLSPPRAVLVLSLYLGLWLAISIPLQRETRLDNWYSDALLAVGNAPSSQFGSAWKGKVFQLEMWDRALPKGLAKRITAAGASPTIGSGSLAVYDFSGSSPFRDQKGFLPDLSWQPKTLVLADSGSAVLDVSPWLTSRAPVSPLSDAIRASEQFSVRVLCEPAQVDGGGGQMISISRAGGLVNLEMGQEGAGLVFWFRNRISAKRSRLIWSVPDVFAVKQSRNILFSYNGSNLDLYIDGTPQRNSYALGPGTGLAQLIRRVKTTELDGYRYIFYALVFSPAGCILGLAFRARSVRRVGMFFFVVLAALLWPVLFEVVLAYVRGQAISMVNIVFSVLLVLAGSLWVNADRIVDSYSLSESGQNSAK